MPASNLLPVTPPVVPVTCDKNNDIQVDWDEEQWEPDVPYVVPLCKNGPGNVGWIDWTPPAGGTSELEQEILESDGSVEIPSWSLVPETGNINSKQIEDALRTYDGGVVLIPLFDGTCNIEPGGPKDDCPDENVGGNGENQWYHLVDVGAFQFCPGDPTQADDAFAQWCAANGYGNGSYINGSNKAECDTGNGATSCLVGRWVGWLTQGTAGPLTTTPGPSRALVVQLIK